jgi:2-oxoglutarate ferredoxin oxidoreductase subunit beta
MGTIDYPINPLSLAFAAEATFVGRSMDVDPKHLAMMVERLAAHKGSGFLEVYQNCNIFNDGTFKSFNEREVKEDRMIQLEHNKPLIFGKNKDRGIRLNGVTPEIVTIGENGITVDDILVHNENAHEPNLPYILGRMQFPEYPVPMGVFRAIEKPTYERMLAGQISAAVDAKGAGSLEKLINSGETWVIN